MHMSYLAYNATLEHVMPVLQVFFPSEIKWVEFSDLRSKILLLLFPFSSVSCRTLVLRGKISGEDGCRLLTVTALHYVGPLPDSGNGNGKNAARKPRCICSLSDAFVLQEVKKELWE
ncbi:hypothetical protein CEXT_615141 [Caerostris extrusa]|uniref:Uncharacterized protein n=1 Tax=Caerostris extrusa TaxID=172846 RepID=A0AAV4PNK4_CAEEX|nr:hypothetical protein CEXT_615141 [Caerostris extrusa]